MDRRSRTGRAGRRAAEAGQSAVEDATHYFGAAQRFRVRPVRSRAQAPRRPGAGAGVVRPLADVVRQSQRAAGGQPKTLATGIDGSGTQLLKEPPTMPKIEAHHLNNSRPKRI